MNLADASRLPTTLGGQFKRHLPSYVLGVVVLGVYQALQYVFDTRLSAAINAATHHDDALALRLGALLVGIALVSLVVRVLSRLTMFNAGRQAEYELRAALLHRLQRLGPAFHQGMPVGEVMSRVTSDLTQVRLLLGFGVLNAVNTVFALVSALSVAISISPTLTLYALTPLPVLMWVTRRFSSQLYIRQKENQDSLGELSDFVQSSVSGAKVVRAFALDADQIARFEVHNQRYLEKSLSLARLRGWMGPIMQSITSVGALVVFWYGGYLLARGQLDPGGFVAFIRALGRLTWPLMALGFLVGLVQRGRAAYARLADIYGAEPEVVDGPLPAPAHVDGRIEVRHLAFSYAEREVLRDVSFELPPGGSLAIVGKTGSGKSTLARLLARLENTPHGAVFLDGADITDLPLGALRKAVGYAQQEPFLFSTTAAENVGIALDERGPEFMEQVKSAARKAHVLDELLGLPDGLDTIVGERGVQLSGGQKQRVALAGAFVLGPKVLVLDDPLSAVDAKTERGILEAIDEQRAERGVILVTHRVAAAERCDRIIVLDDGRIAEQGTHAELVKAGGIYAQFAHEQRIERELAALGGDQLAHEEVA